MIAILKINRVAKVAVATLSEAEFLREFRQEAEKGRLLLSVMKQKRLVDDGYYSYLLMPDVNPNQLPNIRPVRKTVNAVA